jgi:polysaccharide export outer membrane protein
MNRNALRITLGCCLLALLTGFTTSCATSKNTPAPSSTNDVPTVATAPETPPPPPPVFRVGPGDTITISVWRQDDLSGAQIIDPDGMIQYPPGQITKVAGLSLTEIASLLSGQLTNFVVSPKINVAAMNIKSRKAYVLGEVRNPGIIMLDTPMTILQAIGSMGGFGLDAASTRIILIRREGDAMVTRAVYLNLRDAESEKFSGTMPLLADDIVFIPPSRITDMARFMDKVNDILNPIVNLERGIVLAPDVADVLAGETDFLSTPTTVSL